MNKTYLYIDPPSGWKYGFPKRTDKPPEDTNKWLVDNGYPQSEVDRWVVNGHGVLCRFIWETDEND